MVSEKQIQAAAKAMETLALERGFVRWDEAASVALTAAEQAEPAPLPDDSLSAIISSIGNEIHNLACERQNDEDLSERLSDFRDRLWAIAQQAPIEPAPAARSGAVKVKALEWARGWMNAEAQTEIGKYTITYRRDGSFEWGIGILKVWASSWDDAKASAQADYERRILSALEPAAPEPKPEGDDERIRREMDEVLRKQSERDIPFAPATRPAEQAVTEAMVEALKEARSVIYDTQQSCLYDDDDGQVGVTEDAVISPYHFQKICNSLKVIDDAIKAAMEAKTTENQK